MLYHAACHCEWAGVPTLKGQAQLTGALEQLCKVKVSTIPGCCGESGMGAVTSPTIYNLLRARKKERLAQAFEPQPQTGACYAGPILVGCPSCKIGIARCLIQLKEKHPVLHVLEWLADQVDGEDRRQTPTSIRVDLAELFQGAGELGLSLEAHRPVLDENDDDEMI